MNQPRLRRCSRCGELKGEVVFADQYEGIVRLPVVCICRGTACPQCGKRRIRRPIANHYVEPTGAVWHTPWFGYLMPCPIFRRNAKQRHPRRADAPLDANSDVISDHAGGRLFEKLFDRGYEKSDEPQAAA